MPREKTNRVTFSFLPPRLQGKHWETWTHLAFHGFEKWEKELYWFHFFAGDLDKQKSKPEKFEISGRGGAAWWEGERSLRRPLRSKREKTGGGVRFQQMIIKVYEAVFGWREELILRSRWGEMDGEKSFRGQNSSAETFRAITVNEITYPVLNFHARRALIFNF